MNKLRKIIERIDRRGYKSYRELYGKYDFHNFTLSVDKVQGDPFATPSIIAIRVENHSFTREWLNNDDDKIALCDYLYRLIWIKARKIARNRGTGHSGKIEIPSPGQIVIRRSAVEIENDAIVVRLFIGLPARGRTIDGHAAYEMFFIDIPQIIKACLFAKSINIEHLTNFIIQHRDQCALRRMLADKNLIGFIADGSILPRESGISDNPMKNGKPFQSPQSLRVEFDLPSGKTIGGMGIPEGSTLIVGGGYHGKTTLLSAIQNGIYNHIPGDGREFVIASPYAVKIRAENGRAIRNVDISAFIENLPSGYDTRNFSTDDASGSTSMAGTIIESIEAGAKVLLFDEDTSATNFMIKDDRMVELIENEPIVPLVDRLSELREKFGISVIIVVGGAGEYLDTADNVILMEEFEPNDAKQKATDIIEQYPSHRAKKPVPMTIPASRIPLPDGFSPAYGRKSENIKVRGKSLLFGAETIELWAIEQIILPAQINAIGKAMSYISSKLGDSTISELLDMVENLVSKNGLSALASNDSFVPPDWAEFRRFELAAAINRLRSLHP
ncbi:ABC-ATPase domain-containing protein [bacterium]|nr:ABC-ATPase domain-containing protein [bacterium]